MQVHAREKAKRPTGVSGSYPLKPVAILNPRSPLWHWYLHIFCQQFPLSKSTGGSEPTGIASLHGTAWCLRVRITGFVAITEGSRREPEKDWLKARSQHSLGKVERSETHPQVWVSITVTLAESQESIPERCVDDSLFIGHRDTNRLSLIMLTLAFSQPRMGMFLFLGRRFALPQAMMKTGFQPVPHSRSEGA